MNKYESNEADSTFLPMKNIRRIAVVRENQVSLTKWHEQQRQ